MYFIGKFSNKAWLAIRCPFRLNGFCPQLRIYKGTNKISIEMLQAKINNSNETFKDYNS